MRWPLVGRDAELETIRSALAGGTSAGVVITGAPGVGKTRLATEASEIAEARRERVVWVRATRAAGTVPLGSFAAAVPPATAASGVELLALTRRSLREQAGGGLLVLCVDDGHLLDGASAALVHQLAAAREAFTVVTVRRDARARTPCARCARSDASRSSACSTARSPARSSGAARTRSGS